MDLVDVAAFSRKLAISPALLARTFTDAERAAADAFADARRLRHLAGRFAAKEAVLKALGLGISGGAALTDVEVTAAANGAPSVALRGVALASAAGDGIARVLVSISYDGGFAVAFAVAT